MKTVKSVGRLIGLLIVVQLVAGVLSNFVLLGPAITGPLGFLVEAADHSLQVSLGVLLGFATSAMSVGIAITALPVFRRYSHAMALWLLALAVVGLSLAVVENSTVMSLLSYSKAYATADAADAAVLETIRVVVASSRNWAHYTHVFMGGAMFLVFYSVLYRSALIPRALAAFGLIAVVLQMTAVAMPLFGISIVMLMLAPMALSHLAVALWLTVKGFEERQPPVDSTSLEAGLPRGA